MGELGADLNAVTSSGLSPLALACINGNAAMVRILCVCGASRDCPRGSAEELAQGVDILRFLEQTRGFLNPLQYSQDLTVDEARCWLRSERLRGFQQIEFIHYDSPACSLIKTALVWSVDVAHLFPDSCRRRARELCFIPWERIELPRSLIMNVIFPFVIDRWAPVRWSMKSRAA